MSGYLAPVRGDWVTFHPTEPGRGQIGQVAAELGANQWGRPRYRVEFWTERTKGKTTLIERESDVVSADRLIAITRQPCGMRAVIGDAPCSSAAA